MTPADIDTLLTKIERLRDEWREHTRKAAAWIATPTGVPFVRLSTATIDNINTLIALARDGLAMRALTEECAGCEDEGALGIVVARHLADEESPR